MTADSSAPPDEGAGRHANVPHSIGIGLVLSMLVAVIYAQTIHFDFVNFDDNIYVYDNPHLAGGLRWSNLGWAFTTTEVCNWHPLTWMSHLADVSLYQLHPGGHHLTNVVLHALTTIVLFLALRRLTDHAARSAFVAAVFAVHPLHVESVAWVSERKDVLSGFFFALGLLAYAAYARRPTPWRYALVALALVFGLMCKPMLVTFPFVLLLLDYWPLARLFAGSGAPANSKGRRSDRRVLLEKAPLVLIAAAASVVTVYAQQTAIRPFEEISFPARLTNAGRSYLIYIAQTFWPSDLAPDCEQAFDALTNFQAAGAWLIVAAITVAAFAFRSRRPYLLVGWLWYLGMLVPVIGLVQVGTQAHADRYMYLPQIGLLLAVTWVVGDCAAACRFPSTILTAICIGLIAILTWCAHRQTTYWRDGFSMWSRTLKEEPNNENAHYGIAHALARQGRLWESIPHLKAVLVANPDSRSATAICGFAYFNLGKFADALPYLERSVAWNPGEATSIVALGAALYRLGRLDQAESVLRTAFGHDPPTAASHDYLGLIRARQGRFDEAIAEIKRAIQMSPNQPVWRAHLGIVLFQTGKTEEGMAELREAVRLGPDDVYALRIAAWVAATIADDRIRAGRESIAWARKAAERSHYQDPFILDCLAAACAEEGQFDEAMAQSERALEMAQMRQLDDLAKSIRAHQADYELKKPLRERPADIQP